MADKLGAQQEAIVNGPWEGRNAESVEKNFNRIFRRLRAFDAGLLTLPQEGDEGDILYFDGETWLSLPAGLTDEVLTVIDGVPSWETLPEQADYWGLDAQNQWAMRGVGTVLGLGIANPTATGAQALANQATSTFTSETTAGAAGDSASLISVADVVQPRHDFTLVVVMQTGANISDVRFWFGLSTANFTNADSPGGASHYAAFRYSSPTDTGWVGTTRDGAAATVSAQIAAIAVSTRYKLKIRFVTGTGAYFSVNDGTETLVAANLPGGTSALIAYFGVFATAAAVKVWYFSRAHCRYGS